MKLASILTKYFYERKRLNLAGIGSFSLDSSFEPDSKHSSQSIYFQSNNAVVEDDDLIQFISANTGKMKSLASADLESYLELAKQFLNIGKPFHIEGIGTLVKTKGGDYEFTGDHTLSEKTKETGMKELSATSISDESMTTYESLRPQKESTTPYRRIFLTTLIVITAGIIIYLGYRISRSNTPEENKEVQAQQQATDTQPATTASVSNNPDTQKTNAQQDANAEQNYHFVIETATRGRAFHRYHFLKDTLGLNVQIASTTPDSTFFKLFFVIKTNPADTARIADSLSVIYPSRNRKRTFVEKE